MDALGRDPATAKGVKAGLGSFAVVVYFSPLGDPRP